MNTMGTGSLNQGDGSVSKDELDQTGSADFINENFMRPIQDALFATDFSKAGVLLDQAREYVARQELSPELCEASFFTLQLHEYNLRFQEDPESWSAEAYEIALDTLSRPASTPGGKLSRAKALLRLQGVADRDGFTTFSEVHVKDLLSDLPCDIADTGLWHLLATWAFKHKNMPVIERAFEVMLTQPPRVMGHAMWMRVNLMYQLLKQKATRRDVEETIKSLAVLPQLREFETFIWPACVEAGIVDDVLTFQLAQKREEIEALKPGAMAEFPTQSIRNH